MSAIKVLSRHVALKPAWFALVLETLSDMPGTEKKKKFYAVKPDGYVCIVTVTDGGHVLMVRQCRQAVEVYTLELPSGHVDEGEEPKASARRELMEDTGYCAGSLELPGTLMPDTGWSACVVTCLYRVAFWFRLPLPAALMQLQVAAWADELLERRADIPEIPGPLESLHDGD